MDIYKAICCSLICRRKRLPKLKEQKHPDSSWGGGREQHIDPMEYYITMKKQKLDLHVGP